MLKSTYSILLVAIGKKTKENHTRTEALKAARRRLHGERTAQLLHDPLRTGDYLNSKTKNVWS